VTFLMDDPNIVLRESSTHIAVSACRKTNYWQHWNITWFSLLRRCVSFLYIGSPAWPLPDLTMSNTVDVLSKLSTTHILFQQRCDDSIVTFDNLSVCLFIFTDNVRILYLSNSVKRSKATAKFTQKTKPNVNPIEFKGVLFHVCAIRQVQILFWFITIRKYICHKCNDCKRIIFFQHLSVCSV